MARQLDPEGKRTLGCITKVSKDKYLFNRLILWIGVLMQEKCSLVKMFN